MKLVCTKTSTTTIFLHQIWPSSSTMKRTSPRRSPCTCYPHLFFWAAMAILIFVTKNPVCAIGLFVTIFFSVAYHLALSFTTKSEKEIQLKVLWANRLSVFDYVGIASGVTIALAWNQHVLVMPSLATWYVLLFGFFSGKF